MRLVIMSDTHKQHHHRLLNPVPEGDVFIHCGDITMHGAKDDLIEFNHWLNHLPHKHKLMTFGNHDETCDKGRDRYVPGNRELITAATVLEDSGIEIDGVRFWGTPFHPRFHGWPQATFARDDEELAVHCSLIPDGTDVLITHGPPFGILDVGSGHSGGCRHLLEAVQRVHPKVHCFGHIHTGGQVSVDGTLFINAAMHDQVCSIVHRPIVVDL